MAAGSCVVYSGGPPERISRFPVERKHLSGCCGLIRIQIWDLSNGTVMRVEMAAGVVFRKTDRALFKTRFEGAGWNGKRFLIFSTERRGTNFSVKQFTTRGQFQCWRCGQWGGDIRLVYQKVGFTYTHKVRGMIYNFRQSLAMQLLVLRHSLCKLFI